MDGAGVYTAYEDGTGCDAAVELERVGDRRVLEFIRFFERVVSGKDNHLRWMTFDTYMGIPFYNAAIDDCFVIFAVEDDGAGERTLTLMFAARLRDRQAAGLRWDGKDMDMIRDRIIRPRAARWFHPTGDSQ